MTERLARAAARHPRRTLLIWGAIFVASLVVTGLFLPSALTSEARITSTPESELGYRAMSEAMPPSPDVEESFVNELVVVRAPGGDIADAAALPSPSRQT